MTKFTRTFSYIDWIFSYDRFFSEKNLTENTKNTDHLVDNSIFPYMNAKFSTHKDISRQEMRDLTSERADQAKDHICDMRDPFEETKQAKRWKTNHDRTGQISPCGDESAPEHDQGTSGSAEGSSAARQATCVKRPCQIWRGEKRCGTGCRGGFSNQSRRGSIVNHRSKIGDHAISPTSRKESANPRSKNGRRHERHRAGGDESKRDGAECVRRDGQARRAIP